MRSESYILLLCILFTFQIKTAFNKDQRYNPSTDFLLHENGGVAYDSKRDYVNQFPALKPSSQAGPASPVSSPPTPTNGKRDYVAPQRPTSPPNAATTKSTQSIPGTRASTPNLPPKRDYVASQFPTLKPIGTTPLPPSSPNRQPSSGNVKDLINFYDNKGQNTPGTTKQPSFSSILQGNNNKQTLPSTPKSPNAPGKPLSFGNVVSESNNRGNVSPTPTSFTPGSPTKPATSGLVPANSPKKPVLPSSILSNINNQGSKNSGPTDAELQTLSEELLKKDTNNAAKYVTINYQEKTTSSSKDDKAPLPLLTIAPEAWNIPTVQLLLPLLDNYERDATVNEYVTAQERTEENAFMDAVMSTSVMRHLMTFLKEKGYVTPDPKQQRDFVKQMWFGMYSRGQGKISSSGFEHVFLSELKNGEPIGLHNWIYYSKEEAANRVNYLGYLKYLSLGDKGSVLSLPYIEQGLHKPVGSFFIGFSPELEMALYTLCYVTREGKDCNLKLGSKDVDILTHNYRYRSKNYIGSAYPRF
ncbi:poly(U)-specific endoribonuclease homolog isoform X2 [Aricia agestis]|uniref:poly(U)-specific endoribonuclease homolog isoform X2 n=1 Tax=Aricia agestis TaxID=91739 RepID=UPI001C2017C0|nr:poly(U)-specific endoribonuclease homolog isoform X2 [Aricia agestis]